ncbi:MAG: zf-HC2 domain-containing protein [Acidimicrobiales bacterium]
MACEEWFERLSASVDGECSEIEQRSVDHHVASCPACLLALQEMQALRQSLRIESATPHPALTASIVGRIEESQRASRQRATRHRSFAAAVGCVAALVIGVLALGPLRSNDGAPVDRAAPSTSAPAAAPKAIVQAQAQSFLSSKVRISSGQTVEWRNAQPVTHRLSVHVSGGAVTGGLAEGERVDVTFDKPGVFHYECAIHPGMRGEVVVTQ